MTPTTQLRANYVHHITTSLPLGTRTLIIRPSYYSPAYGITKYKETFWKLLIFKEKKMLAYLEFFIPAPMLAIVCYDETCPLFHNGN